MPFRIQYNSVGSPAPQPSQQPVKSPVVQKQPIAQPKSPAVTKPAPTATPPTGKYMQGGFLDKAVDVLSTPLYGFGGFLKGTRKEAEKLAPQVKQGTESRPIALAKSVVSGIKNIVPGIQNRSTPGGYLRETYKGNKVLDNPVTEFGTNVVSDPLSIVPIDKLPYIAKGVNAVKNAVKEAPLAQKVIEKVAPKFVKGYGVPPEVVKTIDEIPNKYAEGAQKVVQKQEELFGKPRTIVEKLKGVQPKVNQQDMDLVRRALESQPLQKGLAVKKDMTDIIKEAGGAEAYTKRIKPIVDEIQQISRNELQDLVDRGRITSETMKGLMKKGYFHHTGFEDKFSNFGFGQKLGEKRTYLKERKGATGYTTNVPKAVATRELSQLRDNAVQDALKTIKTNFGRKVNAGEQLPEGFKYVNQGNQRLKELHGYALPNHVHDYIDQTFKESNKFFQLVDKFNRIWKPTATFLNVPYHTNNIIGNLYNSWLGGLHNPKRLTQAVFGGFTPAEKSLVKEAGILKENQFSSDLVRNFDDLYKTSIPHPAHILNKVGQGIENNARAALFIDTYERLLKSGLGKEEATKQAVQHVNQHLFDYLSGLTPFESNVMKRIFPFYTWTRKNVPLQLKSVYKQTGKPAAVAKLYRQSNPEGKPEGDQAGLTFGTNAQDEQGRNIRYKPALPIQDILEDPVTKTKNMINPLLKTGIQLGNYALGGTPTDFYTGKDITDRNLPVKQQLKDVSSAVLRSNMRPVRSFEQMTNPQTDNNTKLRSLFLSGFYPHDPHFMELKKAFDIQVQNEAVDHRIRKIINDQSLDPVEKTKALQELRGYR